jgi:hypothetical protein
MKRRGTTTYGAVVTGSTEECRGNDNAFCWRKPCSKATGIGAGRADWQTHKHRVRWRDKTRRERNQSDFNTRDGTVPQLKTKTGRNRFRWQRMLRSY